MGGSGLFEDPSNALKNEPPEVLKRLPTHRPQVSIGKMMDMMGLPAGNVHVMNQMIKLKDKYEHVNKALAQKEARI